MDLALLPCATMPDGKRKEHYLEPLRNAELECLHAKTVEPTMEQYIEIGDKLPEHTGTSSPTPTLTSTSTSTSTTSSDRRKTRRQTRLDSHAPSSDHAKIFRGGRAGRPSTSFRSPRQKEPVDREHLDGSAEAGGE